MKIFLVHNYFILFLLFASSWVSHADAYANQIDLVDLQLLMDCRIRTEPDKNPESEFLSIRQDISLKNNSFTMVPHNTYWAKVNMQTQDYWVQEGCLTQNLGDGKNIFCDLYSEKDASTKTLLHLTSQKYSVKKRDGSWTLIQLNTTRGFIGNQCFGLPLMSSDAFYSNLEKICTQESTNLKICKGFESNLARPLSSQAQSSEVTNSSDAAVVDPHTTVLQIPKTINSVRAKIALQKNYLDFTQSGLSALDFAKISDLGLSADLRLRISEDILTEIYFSHVQFELADASANLSKNDLAVTLAKKISSFSDHIWFQFKLGSTQIPLLTNGVCATGCTMYTTNDIGLGVEYLKSFRTLEFAMGLETSYPVTSDSATHIQSAVEFKTFLSFSKELWPQKSGGLNLSWQHKNRKLELNANGYGVEQNMSFYSLEVFFARDF